MIPGCNSFLQQGIIEILKDMWKTLLALVIEFYVYILIAVGLVVLYFVVTRVFLRAKVYKTAQKEPACVLSMSGRERSLEYLEKFGSITGLEAQVIRYLRKHQTVPVKRLEKTFGKDVIRKLIERGMIAVV